MSVIVTGGAGFIGATLEQQLNRAGVRVATIDKADLRGRPRSDPPN